MKYEKVLFKKEIAELAQVKTTKTQARQIRRRNVALLKHLRSLKPHLREIWDDTYDKEVEKEFYTGCPHCQINLDKGCLHCPWINADIGRNCFDQKFGGVDLEDADLVFYGNIDEAINNYEDFMTPQRLESAYSRSQKFLLGHIQWADMIISGEMEYKEPKDA